MKKLFSTLKLDNITDESLQKEINKYTANSNLYLTFRYTPKKYVVFYKLHLKLNGKTTDLLSGKAIKDLDGNQSFLIGQFKDGQSVEISYGVLAMTKVPKIVAIVSQNNPNIAFQAEPKNTGKTHPLKSGERWEKTIKYKIQ